MGNWSLKLGPNVFRRWKRKPVSGTWRYWGKLLQNDRLMNGIVIVMFVASAVSIISMTQGGLYCTIRDECSRLMTTAWAVAWNSCAIISLAGQLLLKKADSSTKLEEPGLIAFEYITTVKPRSDRSMQTSGRNCDEAGFLPCERSKGQYS